MQFDFSLNILVSHIGVSLCSGLFLKPFSKGNGKLVTSKVEFFFFIFQELSNLAENCSLNILIVLTTKDLILK